MKTNILLCLYGVQILGVEAYTTNKDSCWNEGHVDWLNSASECETRCALLPRCKSFGYYHKIKRSNRRCHLCRNDYPRTDVSCADGKVCSEWGVVDPSLSIVSIRDEAIDVASTVCSGTSDPETVTTAARSLNGLVKNIVNGKYSLENSPDFYETHPEALTKMAGILSEEDDACFETYTGPIGSCSFGGILFLQLRALLALADDNGTKAFPNPRDSIRAKMLEVNKILVADNGWLSDDSLSAAGNFFDQIPDHLRDEGLLFDAPFAYMSVKDAYNCGNDKRAHALVGSTKRGFNVHKTQVNSRTFQGFPSDTPELTSKADYLIRSIRWEVTQEFQRVYQKNSRLKTLYNALNAASEGDDKTRYLRKGWCITCEQLGYQYMQSTSSQLRLAAYRMDREDTYQPPETSLLEMEGIANLTKPAFGCNNQAKNLGTKHASYQECAEAAFNDASCTGTEIMWSKWYNYAWGCRCCKNPAPLCSSKSTEYHANNNWDVYQYRNRDSDPTCPNSNVPMGWFLFHVDQMSVPGEDIVAFYEGDENGKATEICAKLSRDEMNRIVSLTIPGCGEIAFTYDANGMVVSYTGDAKTCIANPNLANSLCSTGVEVLTPNPTMFMSQSPTKSPTLTPSKNPTSSPTFIGFIANKDSCWTEGHVDGLNSVEDCQRRCTLLPNCKTFAYHHSRGNKRCHLCNKSEPRASVSCNEGEICSEWGFRQEGITASDIRDEAISAASTLCKGSVTPEEALSLSNDLNSIVHNINKNMYTETSAPDFMNSYPAALSTMATILEEEDDACFETYTGPKGACTYGGILYIQLRALLLLEDNNSTRAFPNPRDVGRASLFDIHKILVADNGWFNEDSFAAFDHFYAQVPRHLMYEGVLWDAPFARLSASDTYKCNGEKKASAFLGFTNRGFNVFKTQALTGHEQGFPGDTPDMPLRSDYLMIVTRHETAHQFDRVRSRNERLLDLFNFLKEQSKGSDDSWLRSMIGDDYFQGAPQEVIASQVGNQYLVSSSAQLRLAAHRMTRADGWVAPTLNHVAEEGVVTLTVPDHGCGSQAKNLGYFDSAEDCAAAAMLDSGCTGTEIMFSSNYKGWGCRCCKGPGFCAQQSKLIGGQNGNWDLYQYRNYEGELACTNTNLPMGWFLYHVDEMSVPGENIVSFFEGDVEAKAEEIVAELTRDESDRIISVSVPGCELISFTYDDSGLVNSFTGDAVSCQAKGASSPTSTPSSSSVQSKSTSAPTTLYDTSNSPTIKLVANSPYPTESLDSTVSPSSNNVKSTLSPTNYATSDATNPTNSGFMPRPTPYPTGKAPTPWPTGTAPTPWPTHTP